MELTTMYMSMAELAKPERGKLELRMGNPRATHLLSSISTVVH